MPHEIRYGKAKPRKLTADEHRVVIDCDADMQSLLKAIGAVVNKSADPEVADWSEMAQSAINIEKAEVLPGGKLHLELTHFRLSR